MSTTDQPTVTPLSDWEAEAPEEGFIVQLPSSKHYVKVKRTLDMMTMLRSGQIPNPLARMVREMISRGAMEMDISMLNDQSLDQMMDLTDRIVVSSMVDPKVTMPNPRAENESTEDYAQRAEAFVPAEGTLSIFKIPLADRMFIAAVAQGAAIDIAGFRPEPAADVADVPAVEGVAVPAQQPPRAARRAAAKGK